MPVETTVAITDAGGRGAALAEAYAKSPYVGKILMLPGNDWAKHHVERKYAKEVELASGVKLNDPEAIVAACQRRGVLLVDVCQDDAVAAGVVDALRQNNILAVGPTRAAGRVEWDKAYARKIGNRMGLPQPDVWGFSNPEDGIAHVQRLDTVDVFIKATGLAAGKGAIGATNLEEAEQAIREMSSFGDAGANYLIEQTLRSDNGNLGEEFSAYYLCNGTTAQRLGVAQDYKRVDVGDKGPNTGSMGSSTVTLESAVLNQVDDQVTRTLRGLEQDGNPYSGVLYYSGMALEKRGQKIPHIVEYNARWGDPEAECIVPGMTTDLFELSMMSALGGSRSRPIETDGRARVVLTLASKGYPGSYKDVPGTPVHGIAEAERMRNVEIYGAGLQVTESGYKAGGGRIMYVVGSGSNILEAQAAAYRAMGVIEVGDNNEKGHYRPDIGWREAAKFRAL